jgi:hypothetical protein
VDPVTDISLPTLNDVVLSPLVVNVSNPVDTPVIDIPRLGIVASKKTISSTLKSGWSKE